MLNKFTIVGLIAVFGLTGFGLAACGGTSADATVDAAERCDVFLDLDADGRLAAVTAIMDDPDAQFDVLPERLVIGVERSCEADPEAGVGAVVAGILGGVAD